MDEKTPTDVNSIDTLLEGGIETGVVSQVYGVAGTGKTNLVLQTAHQVLKEGKRVVIVDTEGLSFSRMKQIFGDQYEEFLRMIRVNRPLSFEEQLESVSKLGKFLELKDCGLVAVDSINMYMRMEYNNPDSCASGDPNKEFLKMLITLQQLARRFNVPVMITSQVYSSKENGVEPFSGKSMSHIVKSIYLLEKTDLVGDRKMVIKKHRSILSEKSCHFTITGRGLE